MTRCQHNLMIGVGDDRFEPESPMSRAMVSTILARLSKDNISKYDSKPFTDVKVNSWYGKSVAWAYENDIVEGVGNKQYNPQGKITREEFVKMLYSFAKYAGIDTKERVELSVFSDGDKVSTWAEKSMQWATNVELVNGYEDNTVRPQDNMSRAEAATLLWNFIEKVMP